MDNRYTRILEAIAELGNSAEAKRALEMLIVHLKKHGRLKLLPEMARELSQLAKLRTLFSPVVEIAHQRDEKEALVAAEIAGFAAEHTKVNHELLSGWRVHAEGKLIDHSGKGALVALYQKVTA